MPPIIIGAAIAGTAAVASTVIASSVQKKAQDKAQQFAEEQAAESRVEQQRIEQKFSLSPGELAREEDQFRLEGEQRKELERRADLPGEDLLREIGPGTRKLLDDIAERQGKTGEQLFREEGGDVAGLLIDQLSSGDPLAPFQGELQLAIQEANKAAGRRGVFSGEIGDELRGRAAVDLAIKSSRERLAQQSALATQLFNIKAGARGEAGKIGTEAQGAATGARGELSGFLADIQTLTGQARGRESQVALGASGQAAQTQQAAFGAQQDILGFQAGQAARTQSDILGGLAGVGAKIAEQKFPIKDPGPAINNIFETSRTEEDPLLRLGALTGGGRNLPGRNREQPLLL